MADLKMDTDFETYYEAKYKLPKFEDVPTLPPGGNVLDASALGKRLIGFNGGTPEIFPGLESDIGPYILKQRIGVTFVVGPVTEWKRVKFTIVHSGVGPFEREATKLAHGSNKNSYVCTFIRLLDEHQVEAHVVLKATYGPSSEKVSAPRAVVEEVMGLNRGLIRFLATGELSDVTFLVNGSEIKAHKAILAARSEYFGRMFSSGMEECRSNEVRVEDCTPNHFRLFLDALYGGFGILENVDVEDVLEMLRLTDKYQLDDLTRFCLDFIRSGTKSANVAVVLRAASDQKNDKLLEISFGVLKKMSEKDRWNILQDLGEEEIIRSFIASL